MVLITKGFGRGFRKGKRRRKRRTRNDLLKVMLMCTFAILLILSFQLQQSNDNEQIVAIVIKELELEHSGKISMKSKDKLSRTRSEEGVGTSVVRHNAEISRSSNDQDDEPCAILFFGLVKHFKDLALPAIQKNIIDPNPSCDVFLHTYDIDRVPENERNHESNAVRVRIDPAEAYLLTDNVLIEPMEVFEQKRGDFLDHTRKYHHSRWGECCGSHDNMIKQWHSIDAVWNLMRQHEEKLLHQTNSSADEALLAHKGDNHYYRQIGLFRSDVFYVNAVDIFNSDASIADFAHFTGYNDRMFYGSYDNSAIWADRFGFSPIFEERYMEERDDTEWVYDGYHSEFYLKNLMMHHDVSIDMQDVCVWRIRNGKRLQVSDCDEKEDYSPGLRKYSSYDGLHGYKYAPDGYVFDKYISKTKIWAGHWASVWDDPIREDSNIIDYDSMKLSVSADQVKLQEGNSMTTSPGGVVVLGMFQSGSSFLTGLLAEGYGFDLGNGDVDERFELTSLKRQNDAFLWGQRLITTAGYTLGMYDHEQSWERIQNHTVPTACGALALEQLKSSDTKNNVKTDAQLPWLVNDPRMCITLQTWIPLLESKPAVIYTYRDPLEEALLLQQDQGFELGKGLLLWILYNKSALQNSSKDLNICRIVTTKTALNASPLNEINRIIDELTECGIPRPSANLNQEVLDSFLKNHGSTVMDDKMPAEHLKVAEDMSTSDCTVYELEYSGGTTGDVEASLYSKAAKIYCDLKTGKALDKDYVWPELTDEELSLHLRLDVDRESVEIEETLRELYHNCTDTEELESSDTDELESLDTDEEADNSDLDDEADSKDLDENDVCLSPERRVPWFLDGECMERPFFPTSSTISNRRSCGLCGEDAAYLREIRDNIAAKFEKKCKDLVVYGAALGENYEDWLRDETFVGEHSKKVLRRHKTCFFQFVTDSEDSGDLFSVDGSQHLIVIDPARMPYTNNRRNTKILKFSPGLLFPWADRVIWQDAKLLKSDRAGLRMPSDYMLHFNRTVQHTGTCSSYMALPKHPSAIAEKYPSVDLKSHCETIVAAAARRPTVSDNLDVLLAQCEIYEKAFNNHTHVSKKIVDQAPLVDSAFIVYDMRTTVCKEFNGDMGCSWLNEIHCYSDRDQISFPHVMASSGLKLSPELQTPGQERRDRIYLNEHEIPMVHITKRSCHWYYKAFSRCVSHGKEIDGPIQKKKDDSRQKKRRNGRLRVAVIVAGTLDRFMFDSSLEHLIKPIARDNIFVDYYASLTTAHAKSYRSGSGYADHLQPDPTLPRSRDHDEIEEYIRENVVERRFASIGALEIKESIDIDSEPMLKARRKKALVDNPDEDPDLRFPIFDVRSAEIGHRTANANRNLLRMHLAIQNLWESALKLEAEEGFKYDYVMFLRDDALWLDDVDFAELIWEEGDIFIPLCDARDPPLTPNEFNDHILLAKREVAGTFGNYYSTLLETNVMECMDNLPDALQHDGSRGCNSEMLLKHVTDEFNLNVTGVVQSLVPFQRSANVRLPDGSNLQCFHKFCQSEDYPLENPKGIQKCQDVDWDAIFTSE